ncbi:MULTISPECIES: hypothetical protein [unclassified Streptomyces]|uniref:hypothetical protein n=1 Tax=unclassified Streptomyces TaxID=2593676 RepID=UPI00093BFD5D|nr:hypothetical protein [Streptomyces sp. CB02400]OKK13921.1 hypothetical protein AMK33_03715 [Streptomyces sp. CB02400]
MIALVRYMFTVMLLSQRYLAPLLLFVGLLAVLTSSDSGPLAATYASAAGALLVCSVWLTMALVGLEDRTHRSVLVVSVGSRLRTLLGSVTTAVLWCLLLTVAGLGLPLVFGTHSPVLADLVLGAEAQLTCAFTGIAIGLVCSRPVVRRQGHALVLALVLVLAALLAKGVSPVNVLLTDLQNTSDSTGLLGSTAVLLVVATGVLAVGAAITHAVTLRKD